MQLYKKKKQESGSGGRGRQREVRYKYVCSVWLNICHLFVTGGNS